MYFTTATGSKTNCS